jgi:hypothetical protein
LRAKLGGAAAHCFDGHLHGVNHDVFTTVGDVTSVVGLIRFWFVGEDQIFAVRVYAVNQFARILVQLNEADGRSAKVTHGGP